MNDASMVVAGIDIGKARLDVALHGATGRMAFDNSAAGHHRLIQWLRAAQVVRVGLESTGSYSQEVTGALREAGFEVAVLQPLQVRAFAPPAAGQERPAGCGADRRLYGNCSTRCMRLPMRGWFPLPSICG